MMLKPQYAILRFAKYKGPEIGHIEAIQLADVLGFDLVWQRRGK